VLGFLATWLRAETGKPVTAGLSDPDAELSRSLDFVTVHHYGTAQALETRLTNAQITRKPVLLEEFGFHTWRSKFPDPHTESEQAEHYAKTLEITRRERIGFLAWTLHDFPQGSMPGARGVERHLGIARADGSLKPVAFVLLDEPLPPREWWDRFLKLEAFFSVILFGMLTLVVVLLLIGRGSRLLLLKRIFKRHTERPG
jgi:Glycosyl hydrolase catalytic core